MIGQGAPKGTYTGQGVGHGFAHMTPGRRYRVIKEFKDFADKNLVLVEVDFPRKKEQSAEQKKANRALQEKYGIEGYPTIVVLNGDGKKVGKLGYMKGGPKAFIAELEKLKK